MTKRYMILVTGPKRHDFVVRVIFSTEISSTFKAIKPCLNSHIINRVLKSWSFRMKFMKLAHCPFHKFYMK